MSLWFWTLVHMFKTACVRKYCPHGGRDMRLVADEIGCRAKLYLLFISLFARELLAVKRRVEWIPSVLCYCRSQICRARWYRLPVRSDDSEIRLSDRKQQTLRMLLYFDVGIESAVYINKQLSNTRRFEYAGTFLAFTWTHFGHVQLTIHSIPVNKYTLRFNFSIRAKQYYCCRTLSSLLCCTNVLIRAT